MYKRQTEYRLEYRLQNKSGEWVWIQSVGKVVALSLIHIFRQELGLQQVKIVIRTGHPGLFSEQAVRNIPEVDGYLTKSGVLRSLLIDTITELLSPRPAH